MANSPSGDSLVSRIVRILDSFDSERPSMTISNLAHRAHLPMTTTHRLVSELVEHRLIEPTEDGQIRIGVRMWELSARSSQILGLRETALPFMEDVQSVVHQHTTLAVLDKGEVLYLERLSTNASAINITQIAGRLPVHATSTGLVLVAHSAPKDQEEFLNHPLKRFTEDTITEPGQLRRVLAEIRQQGFTTRPGIIVPESTGIAVPVHGKGSTAIAALNVIVPRGEENIQATVPALLTAARGISRAMGAATHYPGFRRL